MEQQSSTGVLDTEREAPESAFSTFLNSLLAPKKAFLSIKRKPRWLLPIVLSFPLIVFSQLLAVNRIGTRNLAEQQVAFVENLGVDLPAERREQMMQDMERNMRYGPIYGSIFWVVGVLLMSGLMYIGVMAMGGDVRFYTTIGMVAHSFGAYLIVVSILTVLVLMISPTPEELDIQNLVAANPSFLVDRTESPAIFTLLNSLDLTSVYFLFLLALGMATISTGVSMGMAWGIAIFYWMLWIGIKMIPALIFS